MSPPAKPPVGQVGQGTSRSGSSGPRSDAVFRVLRESTSGCPGVRAMVPDCLGHPATVSQARGTRAEVGPAISGVVVCPELRDRSETCPFADDMSENDQAFP